MTTDASRARRTTLVSGLAATLICGAAQAGDDDSITPARPSVSSPAQLSRPGQLELELGGLQVRSGEARREGLPYLIKLAVSKEWGLLLGGDAYVSMRDGGSRASGVGDTSVGLKGAWAVDDNTALGIELIAKLPTAADALGDDKADTMLNTIYSRDFGPVHVDANLNATRLGLTDAGTGRTQIGAAVSFSTAIAEHWGVIVEPSGTHRSGVANPVLLLTALTFSPNKRLTFDFGLARAARPAPGATSFFAGVVFPLAQLW